MAGRVKIQLEGREADLHALRRHFDQLGTVSEATLQRPDDPDGVARLSLELALHGAGNGAARPVDDARRAQIARQFREVEKQLRTLERMSREGLARRRDYMARLRELVVTDADGVRWMMTKDAQGWLRFVDGQWVAGTPDRD